jgi:putative ABC transport system substrate-binding protein
MSAAWLRRREFVTLISGGAVWPFAARAQQSTKIPRVGVLWHAGSAEAEQPYFEALQKGFEELGYVDGQNIRMLHRFPNEKPELFASMAAELVSLRPDVLVGVTQGAYALKAATSSIPIVFTLSFDPLETKPVDSLSKPSGNATGVAGVTSIVIKKRFQLLAEIIPNASRLGVLISTVDPGADTFRKRTLEAAKELGITIDLFEVGADADFEPLTKYMVSSGVQGLVVVASGLFFRSREMLLNLANENRLPTCAWSKEMLAAGALMYYGTDLSDMAKRAAPYVVKILKGAKPSDLPVEEPTRFTFGINLKTARLIGVDIPSGIYVRVDEVIE